ncbi:MAG: sigma-70 family RNA polymerase sigma factor [Spirochaetes bacterium]|nr:sigma-70 family RNA polymerase sigma factor [Spirochaetota bacterium]
METERRRATGELFRKEYRRMVAFVRSLIDDAADRDGEDIVQDVMSGLLGAADITVPVENLAAYVYRSLRNRVIDALRRRREGISLDATPEDGVSLLDLISDTRYDAAGEIEKREIREALFGAIDSLNEDQRAILCMTELEGISFREAAEILSVPMGTLLARKSRAMAKIREHLGGYNPAIMEE